MCEIVDFSQNPNKLIHFRPGDLFYENNRPFAYALCSDQRNERCDHCFKKFAIIQSSRPNSYRCPNCYYIQYCSNDCQKESIFVHCPYECGLIGQRPIRLMTRLMLRILTILNNGEPNEDYIYGQKRTWHCLMDHYENIVHDMDAMYTFNMVVDELELLFPIGHGDSDSNNIDIEKLLRIYGKILINSFAITEPITGRIIGRALYLGPSIFDHSCRPDLYFQFDGLRLYFIAARDIYLGPADENETDGDKVKQLYISYLDELLPVNQRQDHLRSTYYFECACQRCQMDNENSTIQVYCNFLLQSGQSILIDLIEDYFQSDHVYSIIQFAIEHEDWQPGGESKILPSISVSVLLKQFHKKQQNNENEPSTYQKILSHLSRMENVSNMDQNFSLRIRDFMICHHLDHRQMLSLAREYCQYYNYSDNVNYTKHQHPRLLARYYHWLGLLLLQTMWTPKNNDKIQMKDDKNEIIDVIRSLSRQIKIIKMFLKL